MFSEGKQFLVRCLSPVHAGIGQDLGSIDMPIQREGNTNLPKIEASTFKGSLRNTMMMKKKNIDNTIVEKIFGKENEKNSEGNAGCLGVTDLKLLFYPIKSSNDFYKLVTCPYLINRFVEDSKLLGINIFNEIYVNNNLESGECISNLKGEKRISLDEYEYTVIDDKWKSGNLKDIINLIINEKNIQVMKEVIVISNNDFVELEELNREIITRNKIDQNTGTVVEGALFTEEYLPAESIMYGLFLYSPFSNINSDECFNELTGINYLQMGGNTNLGKGIVEIKIINSDNNEVKINE